MAPVSHSSLNSMLPICSVTDFFEVLLGDEENEVRFDTVFPRDAREGNGIGRFLFFFVVVVVILGLDILSWPVSSRSDESTVCDVRDMLSLHVRVGMVNKPARRCLLSAAKVPNLLSAEERSIVNVM